MALQQMGYGVLLSQSSISISVGSNQYIITGVVVSVGNNVTGLTVGSNIIVPQNSAYPLVYNDTQYWLADISSVVLIQ